MERLSGLDAGFIYMETPTLHMHTLKIAVVDPTTVPGGYAFTKFRDELEKRLHLLPPFRRKLQKVPFNLHHPVWIEDPDFDLDYHVRRVGVPPPGGQREMDDLIGEIAGYQLDRSRPLWQLWALEGLEGGNVAFVAKIHHACADGVAAAELLANVMSIDPEMIEPEPPTKPWHPAPPPSSLALLWSALVAWVGSIRQLPALIRRTLEGVRNVADLRRTTEAVPPRPILDASKTSFNGALTPHRVFATTSLPIDSFKTVKDAFDCTLNDVVLAVVSASMRNYLDARGERLKKSLIIGVPVSTDKPDGVRRLGGNKVSNLFTSLHTDIDDPIARLRAIHRVTKSAKEFQNVLGADMMADWVEYAPPGPFAWFMRQYSKYGFAKRHRPPINLVVSNVPGPRVPLYIAGSKLTALYSVGPVLEGIGLNVTVWSYIDQMNFAAIACRESVTDIHSITDGLHDALAELLKEAENAAA